MDLALIRDKLRASPLALLFVLTFLVVLFLNPAKLGPTIFGVSKIMLGAYAGYWADRLTNRPEGRPHMLEGPAQGAAWYRRAIVVGCGMIAAAFIP
jgi:hypothetical protein